MKPLILKKKEVNKKKNITKKQKKNEKLIYS